MFLNFKHYIEVMLAYLISIVEKMLRKFML